MDFRQLRNIVMLAECRSFSKAATRLNISQPALSVSVRNLEREVDAQLFVRNREEVVPTGLGVEFLVYARSALREIEKAQELVGNTRSARTRTIRFGVNSIISKPIALVVIPKFVEEYPSVRMEIEIMTGPIEEAYANITSARWDFGIELAPPTIELPRKIVAEHPTKLITHPHGRRAHPLAGKKVSLAQLSEQRWALSTLTGGEALTRSFAKSGLRRPMIALRVNVFDFIMTLVEATDWVTFLPSQIVKRYHPQRFAPLYNSEFEFHTNISLIKSDDLELSAPARALMTRIGTFLASIK